MDHYERGDYTPREKAVIRMAVLMTHNSDAILDETARKEMLEHFTESELVELGVYFGIVTGLQKFNQVFQIFYKYEI